MPGSDSNEGDRVMRCHWGRKGEKWSSWVHTDPSFVRLCLSVSLQVPFITCLKGTGVAGECLDISVTGLVAPQVVLLCCLILAMIAVVPVGRRLIG